MASFRLRAGRTEPDAASVPVREAIAEALAALRVTPGERVLVSGTGADARAAVKALQRLTAVPVLQLTPGGDGHTGSALPPEVDVLVDSSGNPAWWASVMRRVRRQGRVLLLIPPGEQVCSFDFYERVHRSSLTVLVRRAHQQASAGRPAGSVNEG